MDRQRQRREADAFRDLRVTGIRVSADPGLTHNSVQSPPLMRRALFAAVALAAALAAPVRASSADSQPVVPQIAAASWYLVGEDGAVLTRGRAGQARAIASITKLMTAVVVLEHARLTDVVRVSPRAAGVGESTVYLRTGEELTVAELLRATLIPSANDAAEALALHVGRGSVDRFVGLMNAKAAELGLSQTSFENPHGLDESGHASSARDATALVRYALGVPFIRDCAPTLERARFRAAGRFRRPTICSRAGRRSSAGRRGIRAMRAGRRRRRRAGPASRCTEPSSAARRAAHGTTRCASFCRSASISTAASR